MTLNRQTPSQRIPEPGRKLALTILLALASTGLAQAQTAPASTTTSSTTTAVPTDDKIVQLDTIVVSGLRSSAIKAIELKRENPQFTDSIVAEDIGKFPDNNLVETMQRLPGIQVTDYARGNIASVTIRGLPDVTTTLNGRNIFTASGLSLSLQDVPASLLSRVDVMKTRSAAHIESGMAGVIDIRTHRPFDFNRRRINVAAKGTYQEQGDNYDPNISVLFSDTWQLGGEAKFGALLNLSYLTTSYRDQSATAGAQVVFGKGTQAQSGHVWPEPYARIFPDVIPWTPGLDDGLPTAPGSRLAGVEYVLARDAVFFFDGTGKTKRPAVNLSLQYSPHSNAEYTFEAFYLGYRNQNYNNLLFSFVDWWGSPGPQTLDVTLYPGTNIVKERAYVGNVFSFTSGDVVRGQTDSFQYSLGGKWTVTPDFTLTSEAVFQDSEFISKNLFMRGNRAVRNDVSVDFNTGDGVPSLTYLNVPGTAIDESNVADPATWNLGPAWDGGVKNSGSAFTFTQEGTVHVDLGWIKRLKFGLRVDDRKASQASRDSREMAPRAVTPFTSLASQFPGILHTNSGFFDGRASGVPSSWVAVNGDATFAHQQQIRQLYNPPADANFTLKESFNIDELTTAGYLMADRLEANIGGRRLRGEVGLRFVKIKTGMDFTDPAPRSFNKTYGNADVSKFLPNAAFSYDLSDNLIVRAGYGETIRRPGFNDLNPLITYQRDVTNIGYGTASGGNPDLKPTTSTSLDLALEYYFSEASAAHVTVFKREIDGLVVPFRRRVTYTDSLGAYDYILSQPGNASNGELEGVEFGLRYYPSTLPGLLQGLGVEGTYTHLSSTQDIPMTDAAGNITGIRTTEFFLVSKDSWSATLAYERSRFSARASYTWRSAFHHHNEAPLFANPLQVYNADERNLNAQISYRLTDNFILTLEGTNLTDDVYHSYYGANGAQVHNFGNWLVGRTFSLGARFSF